MYNTLGRLLIFRFSAISPEKLAQIAGNDVYLKEYPRVPGVFQKLLLNDYLNYKNLPSILSSLKSTPSFPIPPPQLNYMYQLLNPHLHKLTDQQLFHSVLFLSRADPSFHQSQIFEYITKNYLKNKYELLQLNLRFSYQMSIWRIIKHSISRLLVMRYGSINTPFTKDIFIPDQIRKDILLSFSNNEYIRNTMLFERMYNELFDDVKGEYEETLKENLYHKSAGEFFNTLASNVEVWCIRNPLVNGQNELMRELFLKFIMVFREKQMEDGTDQLGIAGWWVRECWVMHQFILNNYEESSQKESYLKLLKEYIQHSIESKREYSFNHLKEEQTSSNHLPVSYHSLKDYLDMLSSERVSIATPLFSHFITQQIAKLGYYDQQLFSKLIQALLNSNPFKEQFSNITTSVLPALTFHQLLRIPLIYPNNLPLISSIFKAILQLDDFTLDNQSIIDLLSLLGKYQSVDNRRQIKNFMFKYISDNYQHWDIEMKGKVISILEGFGDVGQPFDDTGMYKESIFQQINRPQQYKVSPVPEIDGQRRE